MAPIDPVSQSAGVQYSPRARTTPADTPVAAESSGSSNSVPQYLSPVIQVDARTGVAVTQIRDTDTGEALSQYPAKKVVEEYTRHASVEQSAQQTQAAVSQGSSAATVSQAQVSAAAQQQSTPDSDT